MFLLDLPKQALVDVQTIKLRRVHFLPFPSSLSAPHQKEPFWVTSGKLLPCSFLSINTMFLPHSV